MREILLPKDGKFDDIPFGATRDISFLLLPEVAKAGNYVLVHAGFAIQKLDEKAAMDTLNLLEEMANAVESEETSSDRPALLPARSPPSG